MCKQADACILPHAKSILLQTFSDTNHTYICSAQFANLRNFEIALRKLEIVQLQTNFEIA